MACPLLPAPCSLLRSLLPAPTFVPLTRSHVIGVTKWASGPSGQGYIQPLAVVTARPLRKCPAVRFCSGFATHCGYPLIVRPADARFSTEWKGWFLPYGRAALRQPSPGHTGAPVGSFGPGTCEPVCSGWAFSGG